MSRKSDNSGFTLVEMLVYLALFAFIMTSALAGAYQIIEHGNRTRVGALRVEEEHFIIRKIGGILNSTVSIQEPDGEGIVLTADGNTFEEQNGGIHLNGEPLSNDIVTITDFTVVHTNSPETVAISFNTNGQPAPTSTFLIR